MRILKTMQAGVLERTFAFHGRYFLCVSVLWCFRLDDGRAMLEAEMWQGLTDLLSEGRIFDQSMPKEKAEFLCAGSFYAPGGNPVRQEAISVRVGDREKRLLVSGPRHWRAAGPTRPEPITTQPIRYSYAYGGESYADNPTGKGFAPDPESGERALPQVEYPGEAITSSSQRPRPASLEGRDLRWRPRQRYAGTYDEEYMRTRMPGLPDDVDWRLFNDAAEDQWFDQYLRGDEPFDIVHMHPEQARITGTLPGVVGRAFVDRKRDARTKDSPLEFQEIPLRLDTVWLLPDAECGILIHRGTTEVQEDDATDIVRLLVAHENLGESPRSKDHYRTEMAKRADPEKGHRYMLDTRPLLPPGYTCAIQELMANDLNRRENLASENISEYARNQKEQQLRDADERIDNIQQTIRDDADAQDLASGETDVTDEVDKARAAMHSDGDTSERDQEIQQLVGKIVPGAGAGEPDLTQIDFDAFDELQEYLKKSAESERTQANEATREQINDLRRRNDPESEELTRAIESLEAVLAQEPTPPPLPRPQFDEQVSQIREQIQALEQYREDLEAAGVDEQQIQLAIPDIETIRGQLQEAEKALRDQYPVWAHLVEPSSSPHPGEEGRRRDELLQRVARKESAAEGDFAFVDLSGVTLEGSDLSRALLEYVDFTGATLRNVSLQGAVLAKAKLVNCRFEGVNLVGANIGSTMIQGATFIDCDVTEGRLSRADIRSTRFERCRIAERMEMFLETSLTQVQFIDCSMPSMNFLQMDLTGGVFRGSDLTGSNFVQGDLTRCDFTGATLDGVTIISTRAPGACFDDAKMPNVRYIDDPVLNDCTFRRADITMANLRSADLAGAVFDGAIMDQADCSGADLSDARLNRVSAVGTQFRKANLRGAICHWADLREASFMNTELVGTRLQQANLYSVSFLYATLGETDFAGANLDNTILRDWRPLR